MKINAGTLAFILGFVLTFAIVGVSLALAVPYDPGFDAQSVPYDPGMPD